MIFISNKVVNKIYSLFYFLEKTVKIFKIQSGLSIKNQLFELFFYFLTFQVKN